VEGVPLLVPTLWFKQVAKSPKTFQERFASLEQSSCVGEEVMQSGVGWVAWVHPLRLQTSEPESLCDTIGFD